MNELAKHRDAPPLVSLYPTEPAHLADAARRAGCTVTSLSSSTSGLVITQRVPGQELTRLLERSAAGVGAASFCRGR